MFERCVFFQNAFYGLKKKHVFPGQMECCKVAYQGHIGNMVRNECDH